jgi:Ca2+-binding RTX toxin-like protein
MGLGVTAGAVLLLAGASQASAAGVSVTSAQRLAFAANVGETNDVTISAAGANVIVRDAGAPLTAGAGCAPVNPNQVTCSNVARITADLADGDDHVRNTTSIPSNIQGNAGNDIVEGGAGDDVLLGEGGIDQIYAGDGNDTVNTRGGLADLVDCGPGIDTLLYDSFDHVSSTCENATAPPPPGPGEAPPPPSSGAALPLILPSAPGTRDPVALAVAAGTCPTQFLGTAASDRVDGTGTGDRMFGMAGDDVLNGLGGDDCLVGMAGNDLLFGGDGWDLAYGGTGHDVVVGGDGGERLRGNKGNDRLSGGAGNDRLVGGAGHDRLSGGDGDDVLKGGRGRNTYRGGAGRDVIAARNGTRDVVDCGGGSDTARVDAADRVTHCERTSVRR